jgi:photosystem II stability/assembly factor-like uncharacterized protein
MTVGANGHVITSPDGTTWTSRTSGTSSGLSGITFANDYPFGNSTFVTVGALGTILTSSDNGITWASRASGITKSLQGVAYKE